MTIAQDPFYFSPAHSSPEDFASTLAFDDDSKDDLFDTKDFATGLSKAGRGSVASSSSSSNRKGPGGADKRANHNAIERARRENLNGRFMTLAEALPSMAEVKRPSKSIIVNKALEFVYEAQIKENALVQENNELRRELDQLRAQLGMPPLPPPSPLPSKTANDKGKKSKANRPALVRQGTTSFSITPPENVTDEINAAMGITASPNSDTTDSPASTSTGGMCTSPGVPSFIPMFSPISETGSMAAHSESPSSMSSYVSIAPFMPPTTVTAPNVMHPHHQLGFVHPAALMSTQQSMLLAVQYQQQVQQQQTAQLNELYGTLANTNNAQQAASMGLPWAAFQSGTQADAFASFASRA